MDKQKDFDKDINLRSKLTDEEYIERLEYCQYPMSCCICKYENNCFLDNKKTVDIIHRLRSKNERLKIDLKNEKKWSKIQTKQTIKDTAKEIFEKIFEVLCCFTTQEKSKEYTEGYIDCLTEIDKRLQNLAKEKYGIEVE